MQFKSVVGTSSKWDFMGFPWDFMGFHVGFHYQGTSKEYIKHYALLTSSYLVICYARRNCLGRALLL